MGYVKYGSHKAGTMVKLAVRGKTYDGVITKMPFVPRKKLRRGYHQNGRISAKDALDADYFWTDPLPCDPKSLPKYESSHEFQTKMSKEQQRQNEELAKRQKLQYPQQHAGMPPTQHTRQQAYPPHWPGSNHPPSTSQPPAVGGPSHTNTQRLVVLLEGQTDTLQPVTLPECTTTTQIAEVKLEVILVDQIPPPPYTKSAVPPASSRGSLSSGYKAGPPTYPQGGRYNGSTSGAGRGSNQMGGSRNQPYGWQTDNSKSALLFMYNKSSLAPSKISKCGHHRRISKDIKLRTEVNKVLDVARKGKLIGSSLEAKVLVHVLDPSLAARLKEMCSATKVAVTLHHIFITLQAEVIP